MYPRDDADHELIARHTHSYQPQTVPVPSEPVLRRMHSHMANLVSSAQSSGQFYLCQFPLDWVMPVLDEETGHSLESRQLQKNPKYQKNWNESYSNELFRLCQGISKGTYGPHNQLIQVTDTFKVVHYSNIPVDKHKEITYKKGFVKCAPKNWTSIARASSSVETVYATPVTLAHR